MVRWLGSFFHNGIGSPEERHRGGAAPISFCLPRRVQYGSEKNRSKQLILHMKMKFYPPFKDEGEVMASWGEARLIKYLDGKLVLKGCGWQKLHRG